MGSCFNNALENVTKVYESVKRSSPLSIFIVRDFSYLDSLKKRKITKAREILSQLEQILAYFLNESEQGKDTLVLVTSGEAYQLEFPAMGKKWAQYEKKGRNVLYKRSSLLAPIFASGARAENFCGIYEESEIINRMISIPKKSSLYLFMSNPFKK